MYHQKIYNLIVLNAQLSNRVKHKKFNCNYIYYENHHIIPRCLDGNNEKENLVLLTAREHFICHKLLTYIYPNNRKIALAFQKMSFGIHNKKYKISSRDFMYVRECISRTGHSKETKDKIGEKSKNRKVSLETRIKISIAIKGLKRSSESKKRISNAKKNKNNEFFKKSISEALINKYGEKIGNIKILQYKEKISIANTGKIASTETKKKLSVSSHKRELKFCKYCHKTLDPGNFGKWHGENCKNKLKL